MVKLSDIDVETLEELLENPVAEIVLRRFLLGFEGTAEQLASNVELEYGKYGETVNSVLIKLVKSRLITKQSHDRQDAVYGFIPDLVKKQLFGDQRFRKLKKLKETGFIELRTRLKNEKN